MKRMLSFVCAGLTGMVFAADPVPAENRVQWLATITEGYYNDPANWVGVELPKDGKLGKYGYVNFQSADITLKAPPEGLVENSGSIFHGAGSGTHTLTIDTRGTFWEKKGLNAVNNWWGSPFAQNTGGTHIFNFEGLSSAANNDSVWRFDDALFTWQSVGTTRQSFDLWSGTFGFHKALYLGSNGGNVYFNIHPQARINSRSSLQQRGNATTHTTFLGGGPHSIKGIFLKDQNSSAGRTWLHLTNDALVVSADGLFLGNKASTDNTGRGVGILDISCAARMEVTNTVQLGAGQKTDIYNLRNEGILEMRDDASFYASSTVYAGHTQSSTGRVVMANRANFTCASTFYFGMNSNSVGYVDLRGDAMMTSGGPYYMACGKKSKAHATLRDRAKLYVSPAAGSWICLGRNGEDSYARVEATDDAEVILHNQSSVEMTTGGTARAEFVLSGRAKLLGGTGGIVTNKSAIAGNTSISISDDALFSIRGIRGGSPSDGSPAMAFNANGGTLAFTGAGTPMNPYMNGCIATLGAGGLTIDTKGFNLAIDQDFAAEADADAATVTKTGIGVLTVARDSRHPRTHVTEGALAFANGATRFGEEIVLDPGTYLAVVDAGSSIAAEKLTFSGVLAIELPTDYTLDEEHTVLALETVLTADEIGRIVVRNPQLGRNYSLAAGADGKRLGVTVTESADAGVYTWNAAAGAWNEAGNWSPAGVPTHNDSATFASGAAVTVDAVGSVGSIAVEMTNPVTIGGDAALLVADEISVVAGGSLAVSAPLRTAGVIEKKGAGALTISGGNRETMSGDWELRGGVTEFATPESLGANSSSPGAIAISNCTFRYTGEAAEISRPLRITGEYCSILDIVGDLAFNDAAVSYGPLTGNRGGGFVKTGVGTLTFNVPAGTTQFSVRDSVVRKSNSDVGGLFAPVNGEVVDWNGLGQFSVLEGKVVVRGAGKALSTVNQVHHSSIGGSGVVGAAAPELYLKDVKFIAGSGSGFHMLIDQQTAKGAPAAKLILDNADMDANGLYLGYNKMNGNSDTPRPVLAITNGTLNVTWHFAAPNVSGIKPIVRVGPGGVLQRKSTTTAGGMNFNHDLDVRVEDGGLVEVGKPQSLIFNSSTKGDFVLANGGGMKLNRFLANSGGSWAVAFDEGFVQFTENGGISASTYGDGCGFRADAGGGELRVDAGVSHALAVPLLGEGAFTKSGAGTLVITNDLNWSVQSSNNYVPTYSPQTSHRVRIANAGGVRIDEGTLVCVAGTTTEASRFSGVGTLSGVFDVLRLDVADDAEDGLTFADITASQVLVDFGHAADDPVEAGGAAVVAKLADGARFADFVWRAVNLGDGKVAKFTCGVDGVVRAGFKSTGMTLIIR